MASVIRVIRRLACVMVGLGVVVSLTACQKPDARAVLQQILEHTGTKVNAIEVSSGSKGDSARVISVVDGTVSLSGLRDGEFYSDPSSDVDDGIYGGYVGSLMEVDELLVDKALETLEKLKTEGNCELPSVLTSSTPTGNPILWHTCYNRSYNITDPSSGRIGTDPVPYTIDFTDPASFRSLFDVYSTLIGTTTINEIYYSLDDNNVRIDGTAKNPVEAECTVTVSANSSGTNPVIPLPCNPPDNTLGPAFDLNDYGGPEVISETFNRAMAGNLDPSKVFAFQIYYQNGELYWEISSHDSFDFYRNITAYKGTIPHL